MLGAFARRTASRTARATAARNVRRQAKRPEPTGLTFSLTTRTTVLAVASRLSIGIPRFYSQQSQSETPTPTPSGETPYQRWMRLGKEMAQFYWNGCKQLWYNRQKAVPLAYKEVVLKQPLTWEEHSFLSQYRADRLALIPFVIIWLLPFSGVVLPLVAVVFPGLLPSTLRTPGQVNGGREKRLKSRKSLASDLLSIFGSELAGNAQSFGVRHEELSGLTNVLHKANLGQSVSAAELLPLAPHFSRYLDVDEIPSGLAAPIAGSGEQDDLSGQYPRWPYPSLYSSQWKALMPAKELVQIASFVGSLSLGILPTPVLRGSLKKRIIALQAEDKMMARDNVVPRMNREQLIEACDARCLQTAETLSDEQLRWQVSNWITLSTSTEVSPSLLIFFALSNINSQMDITAATTTTTSTSTSSPSSGAPPS